MPAMAAFSPVRLEACLDECTRQLNALENTDMVGMSGDEARAGLAKAEKKLQEFVDLIETPAEIAKAFRVAKAWGARGGQEANAFVEAGELVKKMLEEREKQLPGTGGGSLSVQQQLDKAVATCRQILVPFSASAGFPDKLPVEWKEKSWREIRIKLAQSSSQCSRIIGEFALKPGLPVKTRLGALYFKKRFVLGTHVYPRKTETDRVDEFECRSFAKACDDGIREMLEWAEPERRQSGDTGWVKGVKAGLLRVKAMLPEIPANFDDNVVRNEWRELAAKVVKAGDQAGMLSTQVGGFRLPAWRLKYAVKYFKAAAKAAVVNSWHARDTDPLYWQQACLRLKKDVEPLSGEIDELVNSLAQ